MRILFLYPRLFDPNKSVGGVAEFLFELTPLLQALSFEPVIYAGDKTLNQLSGPAYFKKTIPVFSGPFIKPGFWISRTRLKYGLEVCKQMDIQLIHAQGTYTAGFMALQIHRHLKLPYVVTSHSDVLVKNSKRMTRPQVRKRCAKVLRSAKAVTHLTPIMAEASDAIWATAEKSTLIGNGVNCAAWQRYANSSHRNYLLGIGRLEPGKGFHLLIKMYQLLVQQGIKSSLVIAGSGTAENELQQQALATGINVLLNFNDFEHIPESSIIFTGYVRGHIKQQLIANSMLVLFATQPTLLEEAFGLVQLEAMAASRAIIASDTPITRYLKSCGMQASVAIPEDPQHWASQVKALIENETMRERMGQINLEKAKEFDWQTIAVKYAKVYRDCLL